MMNALRTTFNDDRLKKNNKRALWVHFALTAIGLPLAFFVGAVGNNMNLGFLVFDTAVGIVPLLVTLIVGPLAYIICGYIYLKPTKGKGGLSLVWLTCLTVGWSLLTTTLLLSLTLADSAGLIADESLLWGLGVFYIPLMPLVNAIGFGLMYSFMGVIEALGPSVGLSVDAFSQPALFPAMLMVVSIVPPGLLYIGMRLRQRYPNLIKTTSPAQHADSNTEEHDLDWSNSSCENFNWERETK